MQFHHTTYHIERGIISLVRSEQGKRSQLLSVLLILNSTKLENRTVSLLHLFDGLLVIALHNLGEKLDHVLDDDTFELLHEAVRLESFTRDVEREIIRYGSY